MEMETLRSYNCKPLECLFRKIQIVAVYVLSYVSKGKSLHEGYKAKKKNSFFGANDLKSFFLFFFQKSTHSAASASSSRSRVSPIPMLLEPIPQLKSTPEFLATDIADFTPSVPQASLGGSSKASTLTTYDG